MEIIRGIRSVFSVVGMTAEGMRKFIAELASGDTDRVIRTDYNSGIWDGLNVVVGSGALDVDINSGICVISNNPIYLKLTVTLTLSGNTGGPNNYFGVQISKANVVSLTAGSTSPVAADADNLILAEVLDDNAEVLSGDITDLRVFA